MVMEALGVVVSPSTRTVVEPQPYKAASLPGLFCRVSVGKSQRSIGGEASRKSLKVCSQSNFVFSDQSYIDYYSSGRKIRSGACKEKKVKVDDKDKDIKKRLKRLKGLSRDLSQMGSYYDSAFVDPLKAKMISDAAELLEDKLQQLRSEEKKLKQIRKEEKIRLKAAKMQKMLELQLSSSSSSESSDCGEVVESKFSICSPLGKQIPDNEMFVLPGTITMPQEETLDDLQQGTSGIETCSSSGSSLQHGWLSGINRNSSGDGASFMESKTATAKKIEVCMGGKCKKSGAVLLMQEFQRTLGIEAAAVSGCKCMGKCRDGPNVRISDNIDDGVVKPSTKHLCTGVGLEDVDLIVENLFRGNQEKLDFAAAASY